MIWERIEISSDAAGDDDRPYIVEAAALENVLRLLAQLPESVRTDKRLPARFDGVDFISVEAMMCRDGLRAEDLQCLSSILREICYSDDSRGEVPVQVDGSERMPDAVVSIAAALEHLAHLAGDLGRVRVVARAEQAA